MKLGQSCAKSDGVVSAVRNVVTELRLKGVGTYRQSYVREAIVRYLPRGSLHGSEAVAICKGSALGFVRALEVATDGLAESLFDGLVSDHDVEAARDVEAGGLNDSALFFVDAVGDRVDTGVEQAADVSENSGSGSAGESSEDEMESEKAEIDDLAAEILAKTSVPEKTETPEPRRAGESRKRAARKGAAGDDTDSSPSESKRMRTRGKRTT